MRKRIIAAADVAASSAGAADASTIIFLPGVFGAPTGFTLVSDFDTPAAQSIATGSNFFFPTGDIPGISAAILGNNTPYRSVSGGGAANIGFASSVRSFSFDYSTVDAYNVLTINCADGGTAIITGDDLVAVGQANSSLSGSFIIRGDGRRISGLSLATPSNAFEVDNLATSTAVPEPTT